MTEQEDKPKLAMKLIDVMCELQATLEFSVELNKFYNVDLFQRGYYQIRCSLKTPPKAPAKTEVSIAKSPPTQGCNQSLSAVVINDAGVSKTFQILYRNEDLTINDVFLYRLHTLVDGTKLLDSLEKLDLQLHVELWFGDEENGSVVQDKMECVSTRVLQLHFTPTQGVHHHAPVLFDYFHLSSVELTVHGTLIAIHQPYLNMPRPPKTAWANKAADQSTLEAVYFGQRPPTGVPAPTVTRKQQAHLMHKLICNILLSAYESLQAILVLYLGKLPSSTFKLEAKDCHARLDKVLLNILHLDDEDDMLQTMITDITQLCAENVILWNQFLEVVTLKPQIQACLAHEHHSQRVKRFAEAFFTFEYPKITCLSCYEPSIHGHADLATLVKNSVYFQSVPSLSLECLDLDGDHNSLPIIFEDIYHDQWQNSYELAKRKSSLIRQKTEEGKEKIQKSETSSTVQAPESSASPNKAWTKPKKKFIKNIKPDSFRRPSSYTCSEAESKAPGDAKGSVATPNKDSQGVTLVGFRKWEPFEVYDNSGTVLGTLSPNPMQSQPDLASPSVYPFNSGSMPSLFVRSCWSRTSVNSLPDLSDLSKHQGDSLDVLKLKAAMKNGGLHDTKHARAAFKVHRSHTSPIPDQTSKNSSQPHQTGSEDVKVTESQMPKSVSSEQVEPDNVKQTLQFDKEDYEKLAKGISQALGEDCNPDESSGQVDGQEKDVVNGLEAEVNSLFIKNETVIENSPDNQTLEDSQDVRPAVPPSGDVDSALGSEMSLKDAPASSLSSISKDSGLKERSDVTSIIVVDDGDTSSVISENCSTTKISLLDLLKEEYAKSNPGQKINLSDEHLDATRSTRLTLGGCHRASSDTDIIRNIEEEKWKSEETNGVVMRRGDGSSQPRGRVLSSSSSFPELCRYGEPEKPKLVSIIGQSTVNEVESEDSFVTLRERMKLEMKYQGHLYSEASKLAATIPYFRVPDRLDDDGQDGIHLVVCVHGLDGNSADLRLVRTYIEMALPGYKLEFLMSERNQLDTFAEFEVMTGRLVDEILSYIDIYGLHIAKISFIGHSLGNIIIRSALSRQEMTPLIPKLYTFLSLSGPHLGSLYNTSGLVNMGMWFMQKWKKSGSLLQLGMKDHPDPRQSFLYKLSCKPVLQYFKHVLLVGSNQDRYIPYHSSRIEYCKAAQRDGGLMGSVYKEMVENILKPVVDNPDCKLIRYDVFHALSSTANTIIGRAAHIAVLDSELFIEKFLTVAGLKYFK